MKFEPAKLIHVIGLPVVQSAQSRSSRQQECRISTRRFQDSVAAVSHGPINDVVAQLGWCEERPARFARKRGVSICKRGSHCRLGLDEKLTGSRVPFQKLAAEQIATSTWADTTRLLWQKHLPGRNCHYRYSLAHLGRIAHPDRQPPPVDQREGPCPCRRALHRNSRACFSVNSPLQPASRISASALNSASPCRILSP